MQGSVKPRGWTRCRAWALLTLAGAIVSSCAGEAEVTTELYDDAPGEFTGMSSSPTSASGNSTAGGASEPSSSSEPRPVPSGPSAGTSEPDEPEEPRGSTALSLAPRDVPSGDYCAPVAEWDPLWLQFEQEVLLLVNERRAQAADCGQDGQFGPTGPVVMDAVLRCSARLQSVDMFERDFFDHTNPDGLDPFARMAAAGFHGSGAGENIAVGQASPQQVMKSWMDSDGHCANVMRPSYTLLGVGYHPGAGRRGLGSNFWTQNFGAPPSARGCGRSCR